MTPLPTPTDPDRPTRSARKFRWPVLAGVIIAVAVAAGLFGIYGIDRLKRNAADETACMAAVDIGNRIAPLARGEVAALNVATRPLKLPNLAFADAEGRPKHLADWRGRFALVNLWATWCVPCRKEMPALQALQARLGGAAFEVVAINIDTRDTDYPRKWLAESGINGLAYYSDSKARAFQDLKAVGRAFGMPTTILMDREGCEIGAMAGAAEWASEDAVKLIAAAINP